MIKHYIFRFQKYLTLLSIKKKHHAMTEHKSLIV